MSPDGAVQSQKCGHVWKRQVWKVKVNLWVWSVNNVSWWVCPAAARPEISQQTLTLCILVTDCADQQLCTVRTTRCFLSCNSNSISFVGWCNKNCLYWHFMPLTESFLNIMTYSIQFPNALLLCDFYTCHCLSVVFQRVVAQLAGWVLSALRAVIAFAHTTQRPYSVAVIFIPMLNTHVDPVVSIKVSKNDWSHIMCICHYVTIVIIYYYYYYHYHGNRLTHHLCCQSIFNRPSFVFTDIEAWPLGPGQRPC